MGDIPSSAWRITAGAKQQRSFDVLNSSDDEVDITGWTVDARIRTRPGGQVLHTFPDDMVQIDAGQVILTVPKPVSATWAWTTGWYRVVVADPDSPDSNPDASRVLQGPVVIDQD